MIAEHAMRAQLRSGDDITVSSAGTQANPMEMYEVVRHRLIARGIDPSEHVQRKLTQEILDQADLPVAMSLDHQTFVRETFGREIPLFNLVCFGREEPLLDLGEALPNWQAETDAADQYARQMVDTIWEAIPNLKKRAELFIG